MDNQIRLALTLILSLTSSLSHANGGSITFYGQITEPTCTVANSIENTRLEVTGCQGLNNKIKTGLSIPLSDISKLVENHSASDVILDNMNKLAHQHNIKIDIRNVYSKKASDKTNNYIVELEYY